ncbi:AraC family transcriptional regulator [Bacillus sp. MRMR6]|uniref:helix-turn-helix domain-containing protein n=1 Tax=Bacillus sp. MRMR6 TaxID=1928617 RepID=UPI000950B87F|nr:AraC family transcriptional regulator [Bacillus sp. MRMR6]OLS33522.1 hypothetical protein BTR25_25410 [Bacillus sp. MRMR6]
MKKFQFKSDSYTRYLASDLKEGILSCGFVSRHTDELRKDISHDYYSCFVLLHGNGSYIDETDKSYPLGPNTFCQTTPGNKYSIFIETSEPWYEFHLNIGETTYNSLASLNLINIDSPVFSIHLKPYLAQWFSDLLNQLKTTTNSELPEVFFNAQKLLINMHRENIKNPDKDIESIIAGTKQMLSSQYNEDISLEDIAASFHISYEKLRKLFKETVGVSPMQFRLETKFYYAERLLTEGYSVKSVASQVGYHDPFIFSRQFKKYMGKSPSLFKNRDSKLKE